MNLQGCKTMSAKCATLTSECSSYSLAGKCKPSMGIFPNVWDKDTAKLLGS